MKLIYCPSCRDVIQLRPKYRTCECGNSGGQYIDGLNAVIEGIAIPLGISNNTFLQALLDRPISGNGQEFVSFVIPRNCSTVQHKETQCQKKLAIAVVESGTTISHPFAGIKSGQELADFLSKKFDIKSSDIAEILVVRNGDISSPVIEKIYVGGDCFV